MFDRQCAEQELDALWARPAGHCRVRAAGGGATGITGQVDDGDRRYFLKWLPGGLKWLPGGDPLDAEADGLRQLAPAIRVPAVIHRGPLAGGQALILEWLDLHPLSGSGWETLGVHLRRLHDVTAAQFGHHRNNWIGANRQDNTRAYHWADFFVERRLAPQLRQARDRGLPPGAVQAVEAVMARTPDWLAALEIRPALVHGDLWQGNLAALADGTPVLYDPAVYYGHGETDLAMLGLFGTVPDALYHGYGLDPHDRDFQHRTRLYNLYHLLKEPLNTALRTQRGLQAGPHSSFPFFDRQPACLQKGALIVSQPVSLSTQGGI